MNTETQVEALQDIEFLEATVLDRQGRVLAPMGQDGHSLWRGDVVLDGTCDRLVTSDRSWPIGPCEVSIGDTVEVRVDA